LAREEREKRYASEYMMEAFPAGTYQLNVPLGEIPEEIIAMHGVQRGGAIFRPSRRRIDAVCWDGDTYKLIEFKIRDPFEGLSRLPTYLRLAKRSLDLPHYNDQPFEMILVVPFMLAWIKHDAEEAGITVVEYWREWIADYVREYQLYHSEEYRTKRAEVHRARRQLGLE